MTSNIVDMIGKSFERLTVVSYSHSQNNRGRFYLCVCVCGNTAIVAGVSLRNGNTRSCGCMNKEKFIDLKGKVFGRLTVLGQSNEISSHRSFKWECLCSCGKVVNVESYGLRRGIAKSCGCYRNDRAREINTTHGHKTFGCPTSTYVVWCGIISRCHGKIKDIETKKAYQDRGIKVCDRWRESFQNFLDDMGERPNSSYSLDRIDNNGNYEPNNCRWATRKEQANNKRSNKKIAFNGKTLSLSQWEEETGISQKNLSTRIRKGWSVERALTTPVKVHRKY